MNKDFALIKGNRYTQFTSQLSLLAFGEGTFSPFGQSDPNATVHTACDTCQQRGQERRYSKTSELRPGTRFLSNKSSVGQGVTVITSSTLFTPPVLTQELAINVEWREGEGWTLSLGPDVNYVIWHLSHNHNSSALIFFFFLTTPWSVETHLNWSLLLTAGFFYLSNYGSMSLLKKQIFLVS